MCDITIGNYAGYSSDNVEGTLYALMKQAMRSNIDLRSL